jgi:hypothetical protein
LAQPVVEAAQIEVGLVAVVDVEAQEIDVTIRAVAKEPREPDAAPWVNKLLLKTGSQSLVPGMAYQSLGPMNPPGEAEGLPSFIFPRRPAV